MWQQHLGLPQTHLYTAHLETCRHGVTNDKNHERSIHRRNNDHHIHERILHTPITHLRGTLYRRIPHLICQSGSRSLGVLHSLVKDRTYGKNDSKRNHTPGKPSTMATRHRQQTSYPTTSRVKPKCKTRIESKLRGGQKSCKEGGGNDTVVKVIEEQDQEKEQEEDEKRRRRSKRSSNIYLRGARNWCSSLDLIILSPGQLMTCFNGYPKAIAWKGWEH